VFAPFLSPVSFHALGLPPNTSWTLSLENSSHLSSSPFLNLSLPNGSYAFSVLPLSGFLIPAGASFPVRGAPQSFDLLFLPFQVPVYFVAAGLPNGSLWTVRFNGGLSEQSSRSAEFPAANGTYAFAVSGPTDYRASPSNGSLRVNGFTLLVLITFAQPPVPPPPPPPKPGPPELEYVLAGLVLLLAATTVAAWVAARRRPRAPPPEGSPSEGAGEPAPEPAESPTGELEPVAPV
ncbi:MAG: hypothetical protein L3K11_04685, partial [Thermoplasmata archaeon]|nr:hypothetical protein [Thermoplasmata archaeon]